MAEVPAPTQEEARTALEAATAKRDQLRGQYEQCKEATAKAVQRQDKAEIEVLGMVKAGTSDWLFGSQNDAYHKAIEERDMSQKRVEVVFRTLVLAERKVAISQDVFDKACNDQTAKLEKYLRGEQSFRPVFDIASMSKFFADSKQDETTTLDVAQRLTMIMGAFHPGYLVANTIDKGLWFSTDSVQGPTTPLGEVVLRMHQLRISKHENHAKAFEVYVDTATLADQMLKITQITHRVKGNPDYIKRGIVKNTLAERGFQMQGGQTFGSEENLRKEIGKAWGIGKVWQPLIEKYGRSLLRVFPFEQFRVIVGGNRSAINIYPKQYLAVFKALESAPRLDNFVLAFCDIIKAARNIEQLHKGLAKYYENNKDAGLPCLVRPIMPKVNYDTDFLYIPFGTEHLSEDEYTESRYSYQHITEDLAYFHPVVVLANEIHKRPTQSCVVAVLTCLNHLGVRAAAHPNFRVISHLRFTTKPCGNKAEHDVGSYLIPLQLQESGKKKLVLLHCEVSFAHNLWRCKACLYDSEPAWQKILAQKQTQNDWLNQRRHSVIEMIQKWIPQALASLPVQPPPNQKDDQDKTTSNSVTSGALSSPTTLDFARSGIFSDEDNRDLTVVLNGFSVMRHGQGWMLDVSEETMAIFYRRAVMTRICEDVLASLESDPPRWLDDIGFITLSDSRDDDPFPT